MNKRSQNQSNAPSKEVPRKESDTSRRDREGRFEKESSTDRSDRSSSTDKNRERSR
ncbi:hypothetical protein [Bdellovibrio bacteriovorus]|uniref:hypothetical protein n=1 Tax=Bdellovibrio TaxID=958 RepID=UPI0035A9474B